MSTSRMAEQIMLLAKQAVRLEGLFGFYEYEIVLQSGWAGGVAAVPSAPPIPGYDDFQIVAAKPVGDDGLPPVARVDTYPSMGGTRAYWGAGAKILIGFVGGKSDRPFAAFGDPGRPPINVAVGGVSATVPLLTIGMAPTLSARYPP